MHQTCKKIMLCSLIISMSLTGCKKANDMQMSFQDSDNFDGFMNTSKNHTWTSEFMSNKLCVVPKGEDKGTDSNITGISSLLFETNQHKVMYADNIYERIYPASLTKLLTALVVFQTANLDDIVTISYNASHITEVGAKLCGFKEGDKIALVDLLGVLLIYSGNDAGIAIAEHVSGSEEEFCKLMNETAKKLGAVDTNFLNSHGLHDENHYTTAYDLYLIFNELLKYDKFIEFVKLPSYKVNYLNSSKEDVQITFYTTNRYLKKQSKSPAGTTVIGGKTGTTNAAGNCLMLLVEDEKENSYISLVLKASTSDDLYRQMNVLLERIIS